MSIKRFVNICSAFAVTTIWACAPSPKRAFDVPLSTSAQPTVEIMLNGHGPYPFIVDTGAPIGVIDSKLADLLNLVVVDSAEIGDGITVEMTPRYNISSLNIGGVAFENVPLDDFPLASQFGSRIVGILGMDTFQNGLLTFEYSNGRLSWVEGEALMDGDGILAYTLDEDLLAVDLVIDSETYEVHLDTGSGAGFTLPTAFMESLRFIEEPRIVGRARTVSSVIDVWRGRFAGEIHLGGNIFRQPEISFMDGFKKGNIGHDVLSTFVISIDQTNQLIRFARGGN